VATVISVDMNTVGQSSPGTRTRFRAVSLDDALAARAGARSQRQQLRSTLQ
jgi:allophanate hydrolase subunit 2